MQITATVDMRNLERRLSVLRTKEIPSAIRNTLNDMAFDLRGRMVNEIQKIFDRPTPIVQRLPMVKKGDNNTFKTELYITNFFGGNLNRRAASYALIPHVFSVKGGLNTRGRKGMEIRLQRQGRISANEWMMPAVGANLDSYGNVPGSEISRMLADIGSYNQFAGDASNTRIANLAKRKGSGRYIWLGAGHALQHGRTRGIYKKIGRQIVPVMVVVQKAPRYARRFRWNEIAKSYTAKRIQYHAQRAIDQTISKRK